MASFVIHHESYYLAHHLILTRNQIVNEVYVKFSIGCWFTKTCFMPFNHKQKTREKQENTLAVSFTRGVGTKGKYTDKSFCFMSYAYLKNNVNINIPSTYIQTGTALLRCYEYMSIISKSNVMS